MSSVMLYIRYRSLIRIVIIHALKYMKSKRKIIQIYTLVSLDSFTHVYIQLILIVSLFTAISLYSEHHKRCKQIKVSFATLAAYCHATDLNISKYFLSSPRLFE